MGQRGLAALDLLGEFAVLLEVEVTQHHPPPTGDLTVVLGVEISGPGAGIGACDPASGGVPMCCLRARHWSSPSACWPTSNQVYLNTGEVTVEIMEGLYKIRFEFRNRGNLFVLCRPCYRTHKVDSRTKWILHTLVLGTLISPGDRISATSTDPHMVS